MRKFFSLTVLIGLSIFLSSCSFSDDLEALNNELNTVENDLLETTNDHASEIESLTSELDILKSQYEEDVEDLDNDILALQNEIDKIDVQSLISETISSAEKSVVRVACYMDDEYNGSGSGVIYKEMNGVYYLITNQHVVDDCDSYKVLLSDNSEVLAYLAGSDFYLDIAVLKFNSDEHYEVTTFGDSNNLSVGNIIISIGSPVSSLNYNTSTMGIISGLNRFVYDDIDEYMGELYIQVDAPINPGNSGGGLFDLEGNLIGINTLKLVDESIEGMAFAIPINAVLNVLESIEHGDDYLRTANWYEWMINVNAIRNNPTEYPDIFIPNSILNGVYVSDPNESGLFGVAGVEDGDIILMIDGVRVEYWYEVKHQLYYQHTKDDDFTITVYRDEEEVILNYDHTLYEEGYLYYGEIDFDNGDFYIGDIYEDMMHGYGSLYYANGNVYYGDFRYDNRDGSGFIVYTDGDMFFGEFSYDEPYGDGTYYFSDGDYFKAFWIDWGNTINGMYYFSSGSIDYTNLVDYAWVDY